MKTSTHFTITFAACFCICVLHHNLVSSLDLTEDVPALKNVQKICRVESGVSDEVYKAALNNNMDGNDRNLQCYVKCMFEKMNTMNSEGNINLQSFIDQLGQENKDKHSENLLACQSEVVEDDHCLKGMKFYQCFQEKGGSKFTFI